jgi:hypothetical protein
LSLSSDIPNSLKIFNKIQFLCLALGKPVSKGTFADPCGSQEHNPWVRQGVDGAAAGLPLHHPQGQQAAESHQQHSRAAGWGGRHQLTCFPSAGATNWLIYI